MSKFIIRALFFAIPLLLIIVCAEIVFRNIPNNYQYKYTFLRDNCKDIEVLVLGSSLELDGINPNLFHRKAFNAAYYRQTPEVDRMWFDTFADSMHSLKVLIIPLSYFSLSYHHFNNDFYYYHYKRDCNFTPCGMKTRQNFAVLSFPIKDVLKQSMNALFTKDYSNIYIDSSGWEAFNGNFEKAPFREGCTASIIADNNGKCNGSSLCTLPIYKDIIRKCQSINIQVIIISTPLTRYYRSLCNYDRIINTQETGAQLEKQFSNVHYINLFESNIFVDSDFNDASHLNINGASKLTSIIDKYIESLIVEN